ncbi:hypothetical protein ACK3Y8_15125 [Aeromonas caviae]
MSEPELNVDIPNIAGWPTQSVDSLCSLISRGTAPVYVEHSEVLAIGQRCVASTGFAPDFARPHSHRAMRNVLKPESGDVLLNSTGTGTIGRSVVFNSPGTFIVDGHVTVMRPRAELADSRWLNSVLRTPALQRHLERFCFAGSTNQLELSRTPLRVSRLPTPHIDEQRAMGLVIDTLDTAIHETEAIIAKLKAVKQGLLHDLLTRGIDANGELRPTQAEAPHLYKESPLGWIPKEWGLKPLGKILAEPTKNGLYKPSQFHGRGPLMVQMGGLFAGDAATFDTATRVQVTPFEFNVFGLANGDLLFARRSLVFEGAGQCVIVRDLAEPATFESSIVRVRVRPEEAHPEFVLQFLRGHRSNAQRRKLIRQVAVSGVSGADIRELLVALPQLEEQGWIVDRQLEMQTRIDLELATAAKLRNQKAGLMDDLLTGRVRVTPLLAEAEQQAGSD